jgi:hypothetical protein
MGPTDPIDQDHDPAMDEVPRMFRTLFRVMETIPREPAWDLEYRRSTLLAGWVDEHRESLQWWKNFAVRPPASADSPIPAASPKELTELYALSRVFDCFISDGFSNEIFRQLGDALGGREVEEADFHPFYHEIALVEQAKDEAQPIVIMDWTWPCMMLGDLLLCRGGVMVSGGIQCIDGTIAESSTLYWTYNRGKNGRGCSDLSHGWGHNSQWATDFRRDYRIGGRFYYNVDGVVDLAADPATWPRGNSDTLSMAERLEVLRHRGCVISRIPSQHDLFPFKWRWSEIAGQ